MQYFNQLKLFLGCIVTFVLVLFVSCSEERNNLLDPNGTEYRAPTITSQPASVTVLEGKSAKFSVLAIGTALEYQWYKNDSLIKKQTLPDLIIDNVNVFDDNAQYFCMVSNKRGKIKSSCAVLDVYALPKIVELPKTLEVFNGGKDTFLIVQATGDNLKYQWEKNGVIDTSKNSNTCHIKEISFLNNNETWRCIVSNDSGSVTSNLVTLHVRPNPPKINIHPQSISVSDSTNIFLTVSAEGDSLNYLWIKNGIDTIKGYKGSLKVLAVYNENGSTDNYRCIISNSTSSCKSEKATITIIPLIPRITVQPVNDTVLENDTAFFNVAALGKALKFKWQKIGSSESLFNGDLPNYRTALTEYTNNGDKYRCIVSNAGGADTSETATLIVKCRPPVIKSQTGNTTIQDGTSAIFGISAKGTNRSYYWYKSGNDSIIGNDSSYTTPKVKLSDNGTKYWCVVKNDGGSVVSDTITLFVMCRPVSIKTQPANITVTEDDSASFFVEVNDDEVEFQWLKNDIVISGATSSKIKLGNISLSDDSSSFVCKITNPCTTTYSKPAILSVKCKPIAITTQPKNVSVTENGSASLSVVATGKNLTYQWYKNGNAILDTSATKAVYTIKNVSYLEHGDSLYQCKVSNPCTTITTESAKLTVNLLPPQIVTSPKDSIIDEFGTARFSVTASGTNIVYQWQKISGNDTADIQGENKNTLTIPGVDYLKNGTKYRCKVENSGGIVYSGIAVLSVNCGLPVITVQPKSQSVEIMDIVSFSVSVTGSVVFNYKWYKNDTLLQSTDSLYTIENVKLANNGDSIWCVVSNDGGTVTSSKAVLTVKCNNPTIISQPETLVTVIENKTVTLNVSAAGSALEYKWLRNDTVLTNVTSELVTPAILSGNSDKYRCVVYNECGSDTTKPIAFNVVSKPVITVQPIDQSVAEGETVTISITATGTGLTYQWYKNDTVYCNTSSFEIAGCFLSNCGEYVCKVSNSAGTVTSNTAVLSVHSKRNIEIFYDDFDDNDNSWRIGDKIFGGDTGYYNAQIDEGYYIIDYNMLGFSNHFFHTISSLSTAETYSIEINAKFLEGDESAFFGIGFGNLWQEGYVYHINNNKRFQVGEKYDDEWLTNPIPITSSTHINSILSNTLKVTIDGDDGYFYINNTWVGTVKNMKNYGNKVGFVVSETMKVEFDYIDVYK